jgi:hypothetical protein
MYHWYRYLGNNILIFIPISFPFFIYLATCTFARYRFMWYKWYPGKPGSRGEKTGFRNPENLLKTALKKPQTAGETLGNRHGITCYSRRLTGPADATDGISKNAVMPKTISTVYLQYQNDGMTRLTAFC